MSDSDIDDIMEAYGKLPGLLDHMQTSNNIILKAVLTTLALQNGGTLKVAIDKRIIEKKVDMITKELGKDLFEFKVLSIGGEKLEDKNDKTH